MRTIINKRTILIIATLIVLIIVLLYCIGKDLSSDTIAGISVVEMDNEYNSSLISGKSVDLYVMEIYAQFHYKKEYRKKGLTLISAQRAFKLGEKELRKFYGRDAFENTHPIVIDFTEGSVYFVIFDNETSIGLNPTAVVDKVTGRVLEAELY